MTTLSVPYVSQIDGPGAGAHKNDCGPACVVMLARGAGKPNLRIDEFYSALKITADAYINGGQLREAAAKFGFSLTAKHSSLEILKKDLDARHPFIPLIRYGALSDLGLTESKFKGPHFLLVVGYQPGQIVTHDPLWADFGGRYRAYPERDFYRAWSEKSLDSNPVLWGLQAVPAYPLAIDVTNPEAPVPAPPVWGTGIVQGNLRLRQSYPSGPTLYFLKRGDLVELLGPSEDGWFHVRFGSIEGWAGGAYIEASEIVPAPLPPPKPEAQLFENLSDGEVRQVIRTLAEKAGLVDPDGRMVV